jgi:Glucose-6-phosphate dehydrogenase, NAD binding domain
MTKAVTMNDAAQRPDNHVIVLFGATGDLAGRKLLPGLFHLHAAGLLPREYRVIGSAPPSFAMTDDQFRAHATDAVGKFGITKRTIHPGCRSPNACPSRRPNPVTRPSWRRQSSGRRKK